MSGTIDALIASASKAHTQGNLEEAAKFAKAALDIDPLDARALLLRGVVAAKSGGLDDALEFLEKAAARDPRSFFARFWMATALRFSGQSADAILWGRKALECNGPRPMALNLIGLCCLDLQDFEQAVQAFEAAALGLPNLAEIQFGLGKALLGLARFDEAIKAFLKADKLEPNSILTITELCQASHLVIDSEGAAKWARKLVELQPDSPSSHLALATALIESSRPEEAESHVLRALELNPTDWNGVAALGGVLRSLGRIDEAKEHFKRSIELEPHQGFAYLSLAESQRAKESDRPFVNKMIELAADNALETRHVSQLEYAIGKSLEDLGEYEDAMKHYDEANRIAYKIKFGDRPFDREKKEQHERFITESFTNAFFNRYKDAAIESDLPIFVVGMMRSGTTLTEQILSSHPQVGAGGEQRFWSYNTLSMFDSRGTTFYTDQAKSLAEKYCALLHSISPNTPHVVDKMPTNYELIGLIQTILPNAPIIHVKRNAADTCMSIYATANRSPIDWLHKKANIVFAYQSYLRIMDHWRSVLPPGRIMEVHYEDLVSDRERVTREMIRYCGLEWSDACLSPEQNVRAVVTPSVWQVRQPVYKSSMKRADRFGPWLGEFSKMLDK